MVVKIYGAPFSTCTQRVALACKEAGVPYELQDIGQDWSILKTDEWKVKQPFSMVPYLEDGEFSLYESRAMARYLVVKYGNNSALVPPSSDIEAYARFDAASSVEVSNFDKYAGEIIWEKVFKQWYGGSTDEERVKVLLEKLELRMDGYELILSKQKYLAGEVLTLADLSHVPYGWMLEKNLTLDLFQKRPNVARWWNELTTRPAWQEIVNGKI